MNPRESVRDHEDHTAEKGSNSINHNNLVRKFFPMSQALKNTSCKMSSGRMEEARKAASVSKIKSKIVLFLEA